MFVYTGGYTGRTNVHVTSYRPAIIETKTSSKIDRLLAHLRFIFLIIEYLFEAIGLVLRSNSMAIMCIEVKSAQPERYWPDLIDIGLSNWSKKMLSSLPQARIFLNLFDETLYEMTAHVRSYMYTDKHKDKRPVLRLLRIEGWFHGC